jgi:hypothetical protein
MANTSQESEREHKLAKVEGEILQTLDDAYPKASRIANGADVEEFGPLNEIRRRAGSRNVKIPGHEGEPLFEEAITDLGRKRLITSQGVAGSSYHTISSEGIRELGQSQSATAVDVQNILPKLTGQVAKIAEAIEANRAEQDKLNRKHADFEKKLLHLERSFYGHLFPWFAVFVAAFALILTGAQTTARITANDPWQVLAQSAAVMAPITIAILLLVGAAWLSVVPASRSSVTNCQNAEFDEIKYLQ